LFSFSCACLRGSTNGSKPVSADSTYTIPNPGVLAPGTGGLMGRVTDKKCGEGLQFAEVRVSGMRLSVSTDNSGSYTMVNIPPGTHTVEARMMGFKTVEIKKVQIQPDRIKHLNIKLKHHVFKIPGW
jgi:hypothetical protein